MGVCLCDPALEHNLSPKQITSLLKINEFNVCEWTRNSMSFEYPSHMNPFLSYESNL